MLDWLDRLDGLRVASLLATLHALVLLIVGEHTNSAAFAVASLALIGIVQRFPLRK